MFLISISWTIFRNYHRFFIHLRLFEKLMPFSYSMFLSDRILSVVIRFELKLRNFERHYLVKVRNLK